jgi:hypothetical protein
MIKIRHDAISNVALLGPMVCQRTEHETIVIKNDIVEVYISPANVVASWLERLRDGIVIADLSPNISNIIDALAESGIVGRLPIYNRWNIRSRDPIDGMKFSEAYLGICDDWAELVFCSPFWSDFLSGQASQEQVFNFLAQLYFRTAGADVHNLAAVNLCRDEHLKPHLERHYREELGHAEILRKGIIACGLSGQYALSRGPHATTRALIDYMVDAAEESMRYLGCYGIFHAPCTVRSKNDLVEQFELFSTMYPFASQGFKAVSSHAQMDYELDHDQLIIVKVASDQGPPNSQGALAALRGARDAARYFRDIFDALHFYRP